MDGATVDGLLAEQRRYYRERAPEYDDWWFRRRLRPRRRDRSLLVRRRAGARGGARGVRRAATSSSSPPGPESGPRHPPARGSRDRRRRRRRGARAEPRADQRRGRLRPRRRLRREPREFDVCFFGFGTASSCRHFEAFWQLVGRALKPRAGCSSSTTRSATRHLVSSTGEVARRRLSDGREFDIVKRFWEPGSSSARWRPSVAPERPHDGERLLHLRLGTMDR